MSYTAPIIGSNYQPGRDVKTTAALIRAEIKRRWPNIKASVTIDRFSGGCAIDIKVRTVPFNPLNPERARYDSSQPHGTEWHRLPIFTEEGQRLLDDLKALMDSYNRDASERQTDYWDVAFYGWPQYSHDFEQMCRAAILSDWLCNEALPDEDYNRVAREINRCRGAA